MLLIINGFVLQNVPFLSMMCNYVFTDGLCRTGLFNFAVLGPSIPQDEIGIRNLGTLFQFVWPMVLYFNLENRQGFKLPGKYVLFGYPIVLKNSNGIMVNAETLY